MPKLEITTRIGCKNMCSYCPQDVLIKNYPKNAPKLLTFEVFKTCIDKLPPNSKVHFSGMCEPFLNKDCKLFIDYCFRINLKVGLYTTLIGATIEDIEVLKDKELLPFFIHVPNLNYMKINGLDLDQWVKTYNHLTKINNSFQLVSLDRDMQKPLTDIILKSGHTEVIHSMIESRAGNLKKTNFIFGHLNCKGLRFNQNVLLPNGDVVLCCNDYALKHKLGNLLKSKTYDDIFDSDECKKILQGIGDAKISLLCRTCEEAYERNV